MRNWVLSLLGAAGLAGAGAVYVIVVPPESQVPAPILEEQQADLGDSGGVPKGDAETVAGAVTVDEAVPETFRVSISAETHDGWKDAFSITCDRRRMQADYCRGGSEVTGKADFKVGLVEDHPDLLGLYYLPAGVGEWSSPAIRLEPEAGDNALDGAYHGNRFVVPVEAFRDGVSVVFSTERYTTRQGEFGGEFRVRASFKLEDVGPK